MITKQTSIIVNTAGRNTYEITNTLNQKIKELGFELGTCHVFLQHTSASLIITENADPDVRIDLETIIERLSPDDDPEYRHTLEGPDDMSAHGRNILTQTEITIPINDGKLNLGTWQGLYLWEHRTSQFQRKIILTLMG